MAGIMNPLSRGISAWVISIPGFFGLLSIFELGKAIFSTEPVSTGQWVGILVPVVAWNFITYHYIFFPITDYDADYLYIFKRTSREHTPLGSFYKLSRGNNGFWTLYYRSEQAQKKRLIILPFDNDFGSGIYGFMKAI